MIITVQVLQKLIDVVDGNPPETGGILGSNDGCMITEVITDKQDKVPAIRCQYSPNVAFLNRCIAQWQEQGITFMGLFHTHFAGVRTLSATDKQYIVRIMNAMPVELSKLYFPVYVLPEREMVSYAAVRNGGEVQIVCEDVTCI